MLGSGNKLATNYAQALFSLARDHNVLEEILEQLKMIDETLKKEKEVIAFISNPLAPKKAKKELIKKLFENDINPYLLNFMFILADKSREAIIPSIVTNYQKFLYEHLDIIEVRVTTARSLSDQQYLAVSTKMKKMLNKKVVLDKHINPKILGGIMLQIGDKLLDGSITRQIKKLEKTLIDVDVNKIGVTN